MAAKPRLEQATIQTARPVFPVITLVVRLRPEHEVGGVDAQTIVAPMAEDQLPTRDLAVQDAVNEPVGCHLTPHELDLPGRGGGRNDTAVRSVLAVV